MKEREKKISKDLLDLFWHKIGGLIVFNTDYIIISKFISLTMVGIYSSYLMIVNIIGTLISIVTNVISPKIGNFIANNSKESTYKLWKNINIIFIFVGVFSTYSTYKLINSFIYLWLGKEYILPNITVILIMINLFIQSTRIITEIFKSGSGFFNDIHLPLIESILNLSLSLILVNYIGIKGVIIGTIASNVVIIYFAKPILVFKVCFNKNWSEYIKILIEYLVLTSLVVVINEVLFNKIIILKEISNWLDWIKTASVIVIVSIIVSLGIFILNKDFRENMMKLVKRS